MADTRTPTDALVFESLEDLAAVAVKHVDSGGYAWQGSWNGARNVRAAQTLAVKGWQGVEVQALDIVDSAIEAVEAETDVDGFRAEFDVSGCEVDIARYLEGEPECMVEYHIVPTPRVGRVITLCASVAVSSAVSAETIKQRGYGIAALAFALMRLGFAVELWADLTSESGCGTRAQIRTLVKGLNDELDPAKVMFAYAHPAMLRGLNIPAIHEFRGDTVLALGTGYGSPAAPIQDLPEGTIYLPEIRSATDVPTAHDLLLGYMRLLGIVSDAE